MPHVKKTKKVKEVKTTGSVNLGNLIKAIGKKKPPKKGKSGDTF